MRLFSSVCLLTSLLGAAPLSATAVAGELPVAVPQRAESPGVGEIIVAFEADSGRDDRATLRAGAGVARVRSLRRRDTELVRAPEGRAAAALRALSRSPEVRYAELNGVVRAQSADTYWSLLPGLHNIGQRVNGVTGSDDADIDAPEAWMQSLGAGQTVAIVDSGVTFDHRDLAGRFATNPGESGAGRETNAIDDDRNGFVDDHRGWDFVDGDNLPGDANGHGTHVAGTIAALKDNDLGIVGAAPSATVMSLRVLDATGSGTDAALSDAFDLAGDLGIKVVNASLSGGYSRAVREAVAAHPGTLYVAAAGNGGADGVGDDNDLTPSYPCALSETNVVCVGATDSSDQRAGFSNYGRNSVDLFAPGVSVASTWIDDPAGGCASSCYSYSSGTSMAAPHAAATLALMRAANPALSSAVLKTELLAGVDPKPSLTASVASGGRLNARAAVAAAIALLPSTADTTAPQTTIDSGPSGTVTSATGSFAFSASEAAAVFECRLNAGDWSPCSSPRSYLSLPDGQHTFAVRATDVAGNTTVTPATRTFTVATPTVATVPSTSPPASTGAPAPPAPAQNATTDPIPPSPATNVAGAAPLRAPILTMPASARRITVGVNGVVLLEFSAPTADGTGTLTASKVSASRGARRQPLRLGSTRFVFAASRKLAVRVRLSPAGKRLLRRTGTLRVRATIRARGTTGLTATRTVTVSLRRR